MATAKKNTALVKNTARQVTLKGNAAKSSTRRKTVRRNAAKKPVRSRRRYRKNVGGTSVFGGALSAFGGALVINLFDLGVNKIFPNVSTTIRTGAKFGAGFLTLMYGSRISFLRSYAPMIGNALIFAGALDVVGTYLMPKVSELLNTGVSTLTNAISPAQVVSTTTAQDAKTGELGKGYYLNNGSYVEVFPRQGRYAY